MRAASIARPFGSEPWITWPAILSIVSMATLVRTYMVIKLFFLVVFLLAFLVNAYLRRARIEVYPRLISFYCWIGLAGLVWAFVGLLHYRNYIDGALDALRLYVMWSVAFVVLFTFLRATSSLDIMHKAIVMAGIVIPAINLVGLYDQFNGGGIISEGIWEEMEMEVGLGNGYLQFNSINISTMFVIAPYLLSLQLRSDAGKSNSLLTKLALVLSLVLVVLSGRRALWIVVALTPCTVLLMSRLTDSYGLIKRGGKRVLLASAVAGVVGLGAVLIIPEGALDGEYMGAINRLKQAFSPDDERTIQKPYLIDAFKESPVFGSGFGATASYIRSDVRPWRYELTYYQMLFNLGIVGVALLITLFSIYFLFVVRLLRQFKNRSVIPFALLIGFCSLVVGAYSDPYFGGFDTLFFAGLLPYLSTFQQGFDRPQLAAIPAS
jgi:hypothetical protein